MKLAKIIEKAIFLERPNRFVAIVEINGEKKAIHVPNPGRMKELLIPGKEVILRKANNTNRKTEYDLLGIIENGVHISLDSNAPNKIFKEAILLKEIKDFCDIISFKSEIKYKNSRLDFLLINNLGKIYMEIKSCTLVEDGIAKFPDAPTVRGLRHLNDLEELVLNGNRSAIIFIIQRNDANSFMPNDKTNPLFGRKLRTVSKSGVEIYAYKCKVKLPYIKLDEKVKIVL
ncbi:MAG: DNA/RNA nuclease SfsA [Candidatus Helarchaeota archaeon]